MMNAAKEASQDRLPDDASPAATPTRSDSAMPTLKKRGGNFFAKMSVRVELLTSPSTTTMSALASPSWASAMPKASRTDLPSFIILLRAKEFTWLQYALDARRQRKRQTKGRGRRERGGTFLCVLCALSVSKCRSAHALAKVFHRIPKHLQPIRLRRQPKPRPLRMLRRQNVPFRVGHQAKDAAGRIANAGYVALRAIRIRRISPRLAFSIHVLKNHLPGLQKSFQNPVLSTGEPALAVCDRHIDPLN